MRAGVTGSMTKLNTTVSARRAIWYACLVVLLPSFGFLSSCADLLEPAPENNHAAQPPSQRLTNIVIHGIQSGQHVAGNITLTFEGSPSIPKLAYWVLTLSPTLVETSTAATPSFTFSVNDLPEGSLNIHVARVAQPDPSLGMLNILDPSRFAVATTSILDTIIPIVVDLSPPTEIKNVRFDWQQFPVVSWDQNADLNFRGYIVRRIQPTTDVDTVYPQSQTSYTDTSQHPFLGEDVVYKVTVWNGATESAGVEIRRSYGWQYYTRYTMYALLPSPVAQEAYGFLGGDTLVAISTPECSVLRWTTSVRQLSGSVALQGLTPDGSQLYWFDPLTNTLNRVRASDFLAYPKLTIPPPKWADYDFLATTSRIFEVSGEGALMCLDATTGKKIGATVPQFGGGGAIALSTDERTLFGANRESRLYWFDVRADSFEVKGQCQIPGVAQKIVPIENANALGILIPSNTVCIVDNRSMTLANTIIAPNLVWDACFTSTHAYLSTDNSIIEYDLRGGPTGRLWKCTASPYILATDMNGTTLFAQVYGGGRVAVWAVPL